MSYSGEGQKACNPTWRVRRKCVAVGPDWLASIKIRGGGEEVANPGRGVECNETGTVTIWGLPEAEPDGILVEDQAMFA